MSIKHYRKAAFLLLIAAFGLGGCAGHSDLMTKAPQGAAPIVPVADSASVVFIRDSGLGYSVNFSIVDHAGNLLGDAVAKSHFGLRLPPGKYFFFARGGENTDAVQAEVAAGRVYYVRVVPRLGWWLARVELNPVKASEQDSRSLTQWLARTDRLIPLIPKAATRVSEVALPDWAAKAWSALSPSDQLAHTILPEDGLLSVTTPTAPPAATAYFQSN